MLSLLTGQPDDTLQLAAEKHAEYQASVCEQGHQRWGLRRSVLRRALPEFTWIEEVANESWPGQDELAAAEEMFKSWRKSAGHWSYVNGECDIYGYAMALGRNRVWYACGIFGRRGR